MYKKSFVGNGGNSYIIRYRPDNKPFYNIQVKGKTGPNSRDQMDIVNSTTNEPIAICRRNGSGVWDKRDKFKIYTPVPLYDNQQPEIQYGDQKIPMYVYARVLEKYADGHRVHVKLENQKDETDELPLYECLSETAGGFKRYIYKQKRQCAYIREGTHNSLLVKFNPGIDPVFIIALTAILDEMD